MKIKIIADSTCDLSKQLIEQYDIEIIPLHIIVDNVSYDDGININPDQIYDWSDKNKITPTTSAVSIGEVLNVFNKYLNEYDHLICFTISSTMSSTYQVFNMAVQQLEAQDRISVIDSKNLSTGISLLILRTCDMLNEGLDVFTIKQQLEQDILNVRSSFVVDTLTFLNRGGRCSDLTAFAGSALKIHPTIQVEQGQMIAGKKYRGRMDKVIIEYVENIKDALNNADKQRVFITHSGCDQQLLDKVYNFINDNYDFKQILITRAGCVISSHCGPNTLGVLFINK